MKLETGLLFRNRKYKMAFIIFTYCLFFDLFEQFERDIFVYLINILYKYQNILLNFIDSTLKLLQYRSWCISPHNTEYDCIK